MYKLILGVSPHFYDNALGHYGRVPRSLRQAFLNKLPNSTSKYLGQVNLPGPTWSRQVIKPEFCSYRYLPLWKDIIKLSQEIRAELEEDKNLVHCYEGTIPLFIATLLGTAGLDKTSTIINFHQVEYFIDLCLKPYFRFFFKNILRLGTQINQGVVLAAESSRSANILMASLKLQFTSPFFPSFTTYNFKKLRIGQARSVRSIKNLVLVGGDLDPSNLIEDLKLIPSKPSDIHLYDPRVFDANFAATAKILKHLGYTLIESRPGETYIDIYSNSEIVWFFTRAQANLLGSSGRLSDALANDCEVVVPANSAMHDMAQMYRKKYGLVDLVENSFQSFREELNPDKTIDSTYLNITSNGVAERLMSSGNRAGYTFIPISDLRTNFKIFALRLNYEMFFIISFFSICSRRIKEFLIRRLKRLV